MRNYIGDKLICLTDGPGYMEVRTWTVINQTEDIVFLLQEPDRWNQKPQPFSRRIERMKEILQATRKEYNGQWKWIPKCCESAI